MSYIIENFLWGEPRLVRPWDRPDPCPIPDLDLFPRWNRMTYRLSSFRCEVRWRSRTAWRVIVHGTWRTEEI